MSDTIKDGNDSSGSKEREGWVLVCANGFYLFDDNNPRNWPINYPTNEAT
jgi:hypothetical protein